MAGFYDDSDALRWTLFGQMALHMMRTWRFMEVGIKKGGRSVG